MIAQGGYGCVYHPEMNKDGKQTNNEKFVSKIQLKNMFQTKNEIAIGKIMSKIKDSELFFGPVESASGINIGKMDKTLKSLSSIANMHCATCFIKNNFMNFTIINIIVVNV